VLSGRRRKEEEYDRTDSARKVPSSKEIGPAQPTSALNQAVPAQPVAG
jgi:hypothetical protein